MTLWHDLDPDLGVTFDGVRLKPADHMSILGVTTDQMLSMEKQTAKVVRRCYGILFTTKKLLNTVLASTIKALVQALVLPTSRIVCQCWPTNMSSASEGRQSSKFRNARDH